MSAGTIALGYLIAFLLGGFCGALVISLCVISRDADDQMAACFECEKADNAPSD